MIQRLLRRNDLLGPVMPTILGVLFQRTVSVVVFVTRTWTLVTWQPIGDLTRQLPSSFFLVFCHPTFRCRSGRRIHSGGLFLTHFVVIGTVSRIIATTQTGTFWKKKEKNYVKLRRISRFYKIFYQVDYRFIFRRLRAKSLSVLNEST